MAEVSVAEIVSAARPLMLAGQWELADQLLSAVHTDDPAEGAAVALARADNAVELTEWRFSGNAASALDRAAPLIAPGDRGARFDLDFLRLKVNYITELVPADGSPVITFGPDRMDPAAVDGLARRADRLQASAPDGRRAGWAAFYRGLIADNLQGQPALARPLFDEALTAGQRSGDDLLTSDALRHLGGAAMDTGDAVLARDNWERSTELRPRAGYVPGVLSQQVMLAELSAADGGHAGAGALAAEVGRGHAPSASAGWNRLRSSCARIQTGLGSENVDDAAR